MEASGVAGSVALVEGDQLRAEAWLSAEQTHSERLLHSVDWVVRSAGLRPPDLEGVAVGLGPGSFTGLRIVLSTAKGLAWALGVPLVGIPTLEALAHNFAFWRGTICPMIDARRGRVFGALFESRGEAGVLQVAPGTIREVSPWVSSFSGNTLFAGSGAARYGGEIRGILAGRAFLAPPELLHPRGAVVARLGRERLRDGRADDTETLVPLYLQESQAQRDREERKRAKEAKPQGKSEVNN